MKPSQIVIGVGNNRWDNGRRYNVSDIIAHEEYVAKDYINDIALIRVQWPIEFNAKVQPIKYTANEITSGTRLQITGWGRQHENGTITDKLQILYVKSLSNEECQNRTADYIDESHLCTISDRDEGVCTVS